MIQGGTADTSRFGLMPDGTPCFDSIIDDDMVEYYQLSRRAGLQAKCLQGYCYVSFTLYARIRLAPVLKTIFHQCVMSFTCNQSNSDGPVLRQSHQS